MYNAVVKLSHVHTNTVVHIKTKLIQLIKAEIKVVPNTFTEINLARLIFRKF